MRIEKVKALKVYEAKLKERLASPTPEKHKDNPQTLKNFLTNELRIVQSQLEAAKLEGVK